MREVRSLLTSPRVQTLLCIAFVLLIPLALFWQVTLGDKTLIPADILYQYAPFKSSAAKFGVDNPQNELLADLILENYQWKRFVLDSIQQRELPLWNPYLFGGVPFLAAGQHSALYPPSILYYVLPLEKAYGWYTVLNLGLAGAFMFFLARTFGLRRSSSVFAGVAYQLSGAMIVSVVFQMMIASLAWLPFILAMCERVIHRAPGLRNRPTSSLWIVLGSLAIAMHILAGHVEMVVYTALVAALFCVWRMATSGERKPIFFASRVAWLALMGIGGAAIASVQLLPLYELVTQNFRGGTRSTFEQVLGYAFPKKAILLWLMPNIFGNPSQHTYFDLFQFTSQRLGSINGSWWGIANKEYVESGVYVGLLTLFFVGASVLNAVKGIGNWVLVKRRRSANVPTFQRSNLNTSKPPVWFFILLALASVLFIFGTKAYMILYFGLPGIDQLHSPFRWKFPLTLCLAVLAGIGFDGLTAPTLAPKGKIWGKALPGMGAQISPLAAHIPKLGIALGALTIWLVAVIRASWSGFSPLIANLLDRIDLAKERFINAQTFFSVIGGNLLLFGGLLIASSFVLRWIIQRRRVGEEQTRGLVRVSPLLAIGLLSLDLLIAWQGFNPTNDASLLNFKPAAISFFDQDRNVDGFGLWRVTAYEPPGGKSVKPANANMLWSFGIQDIRGYDSIIPKQYTEYMKAIEPQGDLLYNRIAPVRNRNSLDSPLLDLLGVKYVFTQDEIDAPSYNLAFKDGDTRIYRNTRAMPRAYTVRDSQSICSADFAQAIQVFDPRKVLIFDSNNCPIDKAGGLTPEGAARFDIATDVGVSITSYRNNEVWIDVQTSDSAQWLVLNDSYFPGWRAWIRPKGGDESSESETSIYRVNGNFRAVRLKTNTAPQVVTVRFKYSPDSVRFGAFASTIALASILLLGGIYVWRNIARSSQSETGVQRVARNSVVLTAMNLAARLIAFAFAIVVARLLGAEGVGAYYFAVVVIGWFEIVMNFGLNTYLTREVARDRARASEFFFETTTLRMMLAAAVAPVLLFVLFFGVRINYFSRDVAIAIGVLGVSQVVSSINTGLSALFFAYERGEVPAALSVISAILTAAVGAVLLLLGWGIIGLSVTSVIVNLVTLVVLFVLSQRTLHLRFTIHNPRSTSHDQPRSIFAGRRSSILRDSFPLMLNHLIASIEFKVDVPLLKAAAPAAVIFGASRVDPSSVVGWYSTGYRYIDAFNIIPSFFTQSLFPALSRMSNQNDDALARSFTLAVKLLVMVALPLAVACTFLSNWMAGLFGQSFLPHGAVAVSIMAWSMVAGWINSVTNYALIAVNQQRTITRAFVITLVFNIVANAILIPQFSYIAAAVVTIFSEIVKGSVFYYYVRKHIASVNWLSVLFRPALAAGAMALTAFIFSSMNLLVVGLALGTTIYLAVLWITHALSSDERAILAPLVRRGA
jgi:O-antigen/teichoic acid export membrane protein